MVNSPSEGVGGMRPFWVPLVAVALLAGCTEAPPAAENESASSDPASAEAVGQAFGSGASQLPALRFTAGDYNSTAVYTGNFPNPNTCIVDYCDEQTLTFDLTTQVPAQAPVDLTVTFDGNNCISALLHVEDEGVEREIHAGELNGDLAGRLVRSTAGTVTLILRNCSMFAGDLGATSNPVTAEVRTVVRADLLPAYAPVSLEMAPGDRIMAMGSDLEDLVIFPPGGNPIHLLEKFDFTVEADMPSGRYVVVAVGQGDAMLHGTVGPLTALAVRVENGEPTDVVSGQPLTFEVPTQGVPLYAGLVLRSSPVAGEAAIMSFLGDHEVVFALDGTEIARAGQSGCVTTCGMAIVGVNSWSYGIGYLPETLKPGTLQMTLTNTASNSFEAYPYMGYVQP